MKKMPIEINCNLLYFKLMQIFKISHPDLDVEGLVLKIKHIRINQDSSSCNLHLYENSNVVFSLPKSLLVH